ncbi:TPD1 protein homolog 1-like isoform X2 [Hordeum vulgare subsp. vulgare]|uniref:TPD1 protein homolog 1-like isoform X2 n=1 Tax=Hordeum vulgare subsp. vulgare TaxID=112509 RepID=UPI001D1A3D69|nr:TPD1 protein homolog 1-like isoform X2 [Hordeum vulgare subsp. vulgare]
MIWKILTVCSEGMQEQYCKTCSPSQLNLIDPWILRTVDVSTGHAGGDPGPCSLEDIRVSSALTGRLVLNVPEHSVTVENACKCPQRGVVMFCNLGEVKAVISDTTKLRLLNREQGQCLINSGWPIFNGKPITFTYASKTPLEFTLENASPECRA